MKEQTCRRGCLIASAVGRACAIVAVGALTLVGTLASAPLAQAEGAEALGVHALTGDAQALDSAVQRDAEQAGELVAGTSASGVEDSDEASAEASREGSVSAVESAGVDAQAMLTALARASQVSGRSVDLMVQIIGQAVTGNPSDPFSYAVKVANLGPDSADGAVLDVDLGRGVVGATAACASVAGGAACPADLSVADGAAASGGGKLTATIPTLPAGGSVEIVVNGTYPLFSSLTTVATVAPAAGDADTDVSSNSVTQQTATPVDMQPFVSKVQDKETVASGETRTYTIRYENRGRTPIPVESLEDTYFNGSPASRVEYSISCGPGTTNVDCPSWANGQVVTAVNGGNVTRIIKQESTFTLPAHSVLELIVPVTETAAASCVNSGKMSTQNDAQIYSGAYSVNAEATVSGSITMPVCDMVPVVTKVQDRENVASGEVRTYTVRFENQGNNPIPAPKLFDTYFKGNRTSRVEYSISCGPGTTNVACPTWANGATIVDVTDTNVFRLIDGRDDVTLPAHSVLELIIPVKETLPGGCVKDGVVQAQNTAQLYSAAYGLNAHESVSGGITTRACDMDPVVTKTQDKEIVGSGEVRTYTLRFENRGSEAMTRSMLSESYTKANHTSRVEYSISCGAGTTNIDCPSWADGQAITNSAHDRWIYLFKGDGSLTLPAHSVLELVIPVKETMTVSCLMNGLLDVYNEAELYSSNFQYYASDGVRGKLTCVDVSTSTTASVNGVIQEPDASGKVDVVQGDAVELAVTVSNSASVAHDVPVTVTLPNMIDVDSVASVTCVANESASCPTDLAYDPVSRRITGTIAELRGGGQVVFTIAATANAVGQEVLSFNASTAAPVEHDIHPEPGTLNPSSVTFGFIPKPVNIPVVPTNPAAVCAIGGAQWNKPENDERFTWTLTADRHLVVTTSIAYILDNGDGTQSRTHDYGTPEEAGAVDCVALPDAPAVTDPCGAGNASWEMPASDANVTWRVDANGHLIATVAAGKTFVDATTSHDYGAAVEENTEPCVVPDPSPAPDPTPAPVPSPDPTPAPAPSPDPSPAPAPSPDPSSAPAPDPSPTPADSQPPAPVVSPSVAPSSEPTPVNVQASGSRLAHTGADVVTLMEVSGMLAILGLLAGVRARRRS